jgi:hypothetical protein
MAGAISFSPAGENDWVQAAINRPLGTGDRLWSASGARAEIQVGGAMIRMNAGTSVSILNLDDRIAQLQLTQGTLSVRVRRLDPDQTFEIDTPNLAFTLRQPGEYRIDVDPDGNATTIAMRNGKGEVYGEGASYVIDSRQPYRFMGTDLREYQQVDARHLDDFDRWAGDRDRAYDNSSSARYVSPDVVGYQDLDSNGTWRVDATYGNVWTPNRVAAGWAPYRDGHWAWVDPWGWTWVDDAPWGFAVSHYGRWANLRGTWGWVPGPVRTRAYYAPALVVFVGGDKFQLTISSGNVGGVAWFPLGPREVYRPSYPVSRGYFENVNTTNTVINNTVINNYYSNTNVTNVVYANRAVPGAVVAVPTAAFVQSQPVSRAAVRVSREMTATAPLAAAPHVAPTDKSVHGAADRADKPPARVFDRPVVARSAPPAAHVGFAAQQPQLAAKPGQPLDDAARKELKPAAPAPVVKVIAPTQEASRTMRALPVPRTAKPAEARGKPDEGKAPVASAVPAASTQEAARSRATPTVPQAQAPQQREMPEQRTKGEARGQPVAPQTAPAREVAQPKAAPAPQAAVASPPENQQPQRGIAEPAAPVAPQVAAPTPAGHQQAKPVPVAAPQAEQAAAPSRATPPVPHAQAPQQRETPEQRAKEEARGQPPALPPAPTREVAQPKGATSAQVTAPAQPGQQHPPRTKTEPAATAPQAEPHSRVATPESPPPPTQPAAKAEQHGQEARHAAPRPEENRKDSGEQKREE